MAKRSQISKEKRQSIITLRHEVQSHFQSTWKMRRTLKVSSSAVAKTIEPIMKLAHEDRHRKERPRVTSAAEDTFLQSYQPQKLQLK
jgi:hypothetical protein